MLFIIHLKTFVTIDTKAFWGNMLLKSRKLPLDTQQRILTHEEIVLPKILEMFKTSLNSVFIENTVKILANTKKDYSEALLKMLDEIRSTYAMSLACITLGFIADEETIPVLMKKFLYFRKLYPEENYDQGPLHGLIKLYERFYQQQ